MERYQLCCCCLELVCLKSLWRQYPWMDRTEVYGDMLKECFGISWERKDETKDLICEVCITRLRNAVQFKQKVIQSQSMLRLQLADGIKPMKVELIDIEVPQKQEFDTQIVKIEREDDCDDVFDKGDDFEVNNSELPPIKEEKLILEVGSVKDLPKLITVKRKVPDIKSTLPKGLTAKRKVPDIKSILPKGITVKRKVPEIKSNSSRKLTPKRMFVIESHKAANPRHNVALVLHHSTIVPFKSRSGYFNCFYCNKQFAAFDELKSHVNELHKYITLKKLYQCIYRPNDRIRADVSDINCRICKKKIDNLNFLIQHLTDDHNVKFNFHSDTIKPAECILGYDLSEGKFRCCECKKEFVFFKTLSHHMNEHSTEHICDVCGRCFLLADRLRAHSHTHKVKSNVECDTCGKIFGSKMLLKSHIRYKHQKLPYMCSICNKSFKTSLERIQHLEEVHHRAPPDLTCKICFKMFDHHINLNRHMKFHSNITLEPKHKCNVCGMKFSRNSGLSNHIVVHSGEKNFECEVCHKRYGRRKTLMEHLRIHKNDRRFACGACSQAFVQKCSLKNHIKVHHGDVDFEKLIVDKKLNAK